MAQPQPSRAQRAAAALAVAALVPTLMVLAPALGPAAATAPGRTELLSLDTEGRTGQWFGGYDTPAVSGDGRSVAFTSYAALDPTDSNEYENADVYLRDRASGRTVLISRGRFPVPSGTLTAVPPPPPTPPPPVDSGTDGDSREPSLSWDGRYVAFTTYASNVVAKPRADMVVVCDRDPDGDGVFDEALPDGTMDYDYVLVGRNTTDEWGYRTEGRSPSLSADGRTLSWVELYSPDSATPVVRSVRLERGAGGRLLTPPESTFRTLGVPYGWGYGEGVTTGPAPVTASDGAHVAYLADDNADCPPEARCGGPPTIRVVTLDPYAEVSLPIEVEGLADVQYVDDLTVSRDARVIALTAGNYGSQRVVSIDRDPDRDGAFWPASGPVRAEIASRDTAGTPAAAADATLSADGRYLAFTTTAPGMHGGGDVPDPWSYGQYLVAQAVVRDLVEDTTRAAAGLPRLPGELASPSLVVDCPGQGPTGSCGGDGAATGATLSGDGSVVALADRAEDLAPGDDNGTPDVFARVFTPVPRADPPPFGVTSEGSAVTRTLEVEHTGFGPLRLTGVTITGPDAPRFQVFPTDGCTGVVLHRGDTCPVSIRFTAAEAGSSTATAVLEYGGDRVEVPLTARADPGAPPPPRPGSLRLTPDVLTFAGPRLPLTPSAPLSVEVTNPGDTAVTITGVTPVSAPGLFPGDYTITQDTCGGQRLPPGGRCTVTVVGAPRGPGDRPAALLLRSDSPDGPRVIGLRDAAVPTRLVADPAVSRAGRVVRAAGAGFPATTEVRLSVPGSPSNLTTVTDALGSFTLPVVVLDHFGAGTVTLTAEVPATDVRATTPLLVVPGSFQPPGFTGRR